MLRYHLVWLGSIAVLLLPSVAVKAASPGSSFVVAGNGQPQAQIVVGAAAAGPEQYAAEELQRALHKMCGAKVPITDQPQEGLPFHILIGTPQSSTAIETADLFAADNPDRGARCQKR
ncbi:MAG: hypothetical protein ACOX4G_11015 [Limnochordia bacterium]